MEKVEVKLPNMTSPCKDCPFRKDCLKGWLSENKAIEISEVDAFVCHKTTKGNLRDRKQCAGHMLMVGIQNKYLMVANALKMPLELYGRDLVFESKEEFINHHRNLSQ